MRKRTKKKGENILTSVEFWRRGVSRGSTRKRDECTKKRQMLKEVGDELNSGKKGGWGREPENGCSVPSSVMSWTSRFPHCKTLCMFLCIPPLNGCSRPGASCHVMWWMINYDLTIHFNQEKEIKDKHVKKKKVFFLERLKSVNVVKVGVVSLARKLKVTPLC